RLDVRVTGVGDEPLERLPSHAVDGGVGDHHGRASPARAHRIHVAPVGGVYLVVIEPPCRAVGAGGVLHPGHVLGRSHPGDGVGYGPIDGWDDLGPVAVVDLVPVVGRRVVA